MIVACSQTMLSSKESLRKYLFGIVPELTRSSDASVGKKYRILLVEAVIDPANSGVHDLSPMAIWLIRYECQNRAAKIAKKNDEFIVRTRQA